MPPRLPSSAPVAAALDTAIIARCPRQAAASFSTTARQEKTSLMRYRMHQWLNGMGEKAFNSDRSGPSYLGPFTDQPFPANPLFRSQPVLSEPMKDIIYRKVMVEGLAMKAVSQEMSVDVRRIAAVIRMKEMEKKWVSDGKKLASPYAKAVMNMLPQSRFYEDQKNTPHESINDIPVHKLSVQQLFVPVAESRKFTRKDAAKAFSDHLLTPDERSPHSKLIDIERQLAADGNSANEEARKAALAEYKQLTRIEEDQFAEKLQKKQAREEARVQKVKSDRFEFRVKNINAEAVGPTGRSSRAVGWRYGAPHQDRKRGLIKIPTSVP